MIAASSLLLAIQRSGLVTGACANVARHANVGAQAAAAPSRRMNCMK
jgi:hypothetical protein